jgi:hypothetical protein
MGGGERAAPRLAPKKTGARSARARTRGQNPLVIHRVNNQGSVSPLSMLCPQHIPRWVSIVFQTGSSYQRSNILLYVGSFAIKFQNRNSIICSKGRKHEIFGPMFFTPSRLSEWTTSGLKEKMSLTLVFDVLR